MALAYLFELVFNPDYKTGIMRPVVVEEFLHELKATITQLSNFCQVVDILIGSFQMCIMTSAFVVKM